MIWRRTLQVSYRTIFIDTDLAYFRDLDFFRQFPLKTVLDHLLTSISCIITRIDVPTYTEAQLTLQTLLAIYSARHKKLSVCCFDQYIWDNLLECDILFCVRTHNEFSIWQDTAIDIPCRMFWIPRRKIIWYDISMRKRHDEYLLRAVLLFQIFIPFCCLVNQNFRADLNARRSEAGISIGSFVLGLMPLRASECFLKNLP